LCCARDRFSENTLPLDRIVIPTGAPKERSGGTCGFPLFKSRYQIC
jgi:hypothetical protein